MASRLECKSITCSVAEVYFLPRWVVKAIRRLAPVYGSQGRAPIYAGGLSEDSNISAAVSASSSESRCPSLVRLAAFIARREIRLAIELPRKTTVVAFAKLSASER